jgi:hypothetical protein
MKCEKHPNYKGVKPTKRDCVVCKAIFQKRRETERAKGGLHASLTTPGQLFGINHILAEMSCIMIYGRQPAYFWRKDSETPREIKQHYKTILLGTKKMKFKKYDTPIFGNNPIESFGKLMWYVAGRYDTDAKMRKIHGATVIPKEEIVKEKEDTSDKEKYFEAQPTQPKKATRKRKFQNLKKLGDEDGS